MKFFYWFLVCLGIVAIVFGVSLGYSNTKTRDSEVIRVGFNNQAKYFPFYLALNKDWFKEAGLVIEPVEVGEGSEMEALLTHKVDLIDSDLFSLVKSRIDGNGVGVIFNTTYENGNYDFWVKPEIDRLTDLKGKKIGVRLNSFDEYLMGMAMLVSGADISGNQYIDIEEGDNLSGLDAIFLKNNSNLGGSDFKKILITETFPFRNFTGLIVTEEFLAKRDVDLKKLIQVWLRGINYISSNPTDARNILALTTHKDLDLIQKQLSLIRFSDEERNETTFSFAAGWNSIYSNIEQVFDYLEEKGLQIEFSATDIVWPYLTKEVYRGI